MLKLYGYLACLTGIWVAFFSCSQATFVPSISTKGYTGIGVNYGMIADNLPSPKTVAQLIQNSYIDKIKIYNSEPEVVQAFANTHIRVVVCLQNEEISILSNSPKAAFAWVEERIAPYYPATNITHIAVGNEVLTGKNRALFYQLVPAMENIHKALVTKRMDQIKLSTPNSMAVLVNSYPPSSATFQPSLLPVMDSLLEFLKRTGSSFMVNAYPFFAYKQDALGVSLDYALFRENPGVPDLGSGLRYTNLLDAQIDAVYYAMKATGYEQLGIIVSETGWPSAGEENETGVGIENAQEFNANLIKHVAYHSGTPYKPNTINDVYIFALFNENLKPGGISERNFGLLQPNESLVYDVGLFRSTSGTSSSSLPIPPTFPPSTSVPPVVVFPAPSPVINAPPPAAFPPTGPPAIPPPSPPTPSASPPPSTPAPSPSSPPTAPAPGNTGTTRLWCIANPQASDSALQAGLDYACGQGADCGPIQADQSCFVPNTLVAHASYAYNSYYQRHGRNYWNCFFNGAALVTPTDPSVGSCIYPSQ
eukprot:c16805_g1_i1 orf=562-2166(+)